MWSLCLASFTYRNFSRSIRVSACISPSSLSMAKENSIGWIYCMLLIHSLADGHRSYSYLLLSTPMHEFSWGCVFSLVLGVYTPRAGISGFNFWGNFQTVFQSSCVILNSRPRGNRDLTAPHSLSTLWASVFLITAVTVWTVASRCGVDLHLHDD